MYVTCPTGTAPSIDTLNGGENISITWSQVCSLLFRDAAIFYMQQRGLEWNDNCLQETERLSSDSEILTVALVVDEWICTEHCWSDTDKEKPKCL